MLGAVSMYKEEGLGCLAAFAYTKPARSAVLANLVVGDHNQ
jgi:hypothetical protein